MNQDALMRARTLVNDPAFKKACSILEERAVQGILQADNPEAREEMWRDWKALQRITDRIEQWANEALNLK